MTGIGSAQNIGASMGALGVPVVSQFQEDLFVQGKAFSFEDYFIFAADEVKTIIFDSSAFEGENIAVNPFQFCAVAGPFLIDIYTGSSYTAETGDLLHASNRRESLPGPKSILIEDPSGVDLGTRFAGDLVVATGVAPAAGNGAGNMPSIPFEINAGVNHAITITNTDGNDIHFCMKMTWFEV